MESKKRNGAEFNRGNMKDDLLLQSWLMNIRSHTIYARNDKRFEAISLFALIRSLRTVSSPFVWCLHLMPDSDADDVFSSVSADVRLPEFINKLTCQMFHQLIRQEKTIFSANSQSVAGRLNFHFRWFSHSLWSSVWRRIPRKTLKLYHHERHRKIHREITCSITILRSVLMPFDVVLIP